LSLAVLMNLWFIWENWKKDRWRSFEFIGYYFVVALIVLPQMVLYSKSGMDNHYLFPAVIGIAFSTIYPLLAMKERYPTYFKIGLMIVVLIIVQHLFSTFQYFSGVARSTREITLMTDDLSHWAGPDRHVLIYGNPQFHFERLFGFEVVMKKIIKNKQTFLATYGSKKSMITTDIFSKDEMNWAFIDIKTVENWYGQNLFRNVPPKSLKDFSVIVLLSPDRFGEIFLRTSASWFNPKMFTRKNYKTLNIWIYYKNS